MTDDERIAWRAIELTRQGLSRAEIWADLGVTRHEYEKALKGALGESNLLHFRPARDADSGSMPGRKIAWQRRGLTYVAVPA